MAKSKPIPLDLHKKFGAALQRARDELHTMAFTLQPHMTKREFDRVYTVVDKIDTLRSIMDDRLAGEYPNISDDEFFSCYYANSRPDAKRHNPYL